MVMCGTLRTIALMICAIESVSAAKADVLCVPKNVKAKGGIIALSKAVKLVAGATATCSGNEYMLNYGYSFDSAARCKEALCSTQGFPPSPSSLALQAVALPRA